MSYTYDELINIRERILDRSLILDGEEDAGEIAVLDRRVTIINSHIMELELATM